MPLVSIKQMLDSARKERRGIGGFMPWDYESAHAIAEVSKKHGQPVIYIVGSAPPLEMGGFRAVSDMAKMIADELDIDIAVHADHFRDYGMIVRAIAGGYTSVMIDASRLPLEQNIEQTREVVKVAHACGVSVEAELGRLPGNEGDEDVTFAEAFQTDAQEAAYFVEKTGIDALAVSIGTMHGAYPKAFTAKINIARLQEIAAKVSIPLVMHGGSGTPDAMVAQAISCGIAKINVATDLVAAYHKKIYQLQAEDPAIRYNLGINQKAKRALMETVEQKILLFTSGGVR